MGCTAAAVALLLPLAPNSAAASVADAARKLATDTRQLAEARASLKVTERKLADTRQKRAKLAEQFETRLVALYKAGQSGSTMTHFASQGSMTQVSNSLDALDVMAEHEERMITRWRALSRREDRLNTRRDKLERTINRELRAVKRGRVALSKAEAQAAQARREVEAMARKQDSLLLTRVGHPENTAMLAAEGDVVAAGTSSTTSQPTGFRQSGIASMYADSFAGLRTANGERYDPNAFTAAHPSLPFGTWVTVSGPGGAVAVRINDRGPFVGGRIIDLSRAAAQAIRLPGIGEVTLAVH